MQKCYRLTQRADFQRIGSRGETIVTKGLVLQAHPSPSFRIGITASSKTVGNAVKRNRAKRRLRALCQNVLLRHAQPNHDYVLIARGALLERPYEGLVKDLVYALHSLSLYVNDRS